MVTLTPAQEYLDWEYDEFYEKAEKIIRTPTVIKRIKERQGVDSQTIEISNNKTGITIMMAATDDNPTLDHDTIEAMYMLIGDDDIVDIRRYGLFKQISGRILKQFDKHTHVISSAFWFKTGIPEKWLHARGIDFHEQNPWAVGSMCLSPENEVFVYDEWSPSPQKMVTFEIVKEMVRHNPNILYKLNLIDPLANKRQANTSKTVVEDINEYMRILRASGDISIYTPFDTWDTKSQVGLDEMRMRLNNALLVKKPFNNLVRINGKEQRIPTMWVTDNCRVTIESLSQWRKEEWASRTALLTKDSKDKAQERWSHFPRVIDGIFKSPVFDVRRFSMGIAHNRDRNPYKGSFKGV
jgi:hypothetical protein